MIPTTSPGKSPLYVVKTNKQKTNPRAAPVTIKFNRLFLLYAFITPILCNANCCCGSIVTCCENDDSFVSFTAIFFALCSTGLLVNSSVILFAIFPAESTTIFSKISFILLLPSLLFLLFFI